MENNIIETLPEEVKREFNEYDISSKFTVEFFIKHINNSPLFRTCFEMMLRGTSSYSIIELLIDKCEELSKKHAELISNLSYTQTTEYLTKEQIKEKYGNP